MWLGSNETLFMDTEICISHHFHMSYQSSFEFSFENSFKIVKTILYKSRWQTRFDLWAMVCQSCSLAHLAFEVTFLTLGSLMFFYVCGNSFKQDFLNWQSWISVLGICTLCCWRIYNILELDIMPYWHTSYIDDSLNLGLLSFII